MRHGPSRPANDKETRPRIDVARTAMDVIPANPGIYDEPLAEASQIPTFLDPGRRAST